MGLDDVIALFGHSVTSGEVRTAIIKHLSTLSIGPAPWTKPAVLSLLASIAEEDGPLGISARFARSRLILAK
jgi:hypothetical protein